MCGKGIFMMVIDGVKADGYIFGVALNYKCLYQKFESIFNEKPYIAEPEKPVLFIKTPNTRSISGQKIFKRKGDVVQAGPCVGVVIGQTTSRVSVTQAEQSISGYVVVNELSLPEESYYRPVVKAKCQDGFCVIGDVIEKSKIADPKSLELRVFINNELKQTGTTANWIRTPAQLISEVSQFMTLHEGDLLLTGTPYGRVEIKSGDEVRVEIDQLGSVTNRIQLEGFRA